jgi:hypothetical protein
MLFMTFYDEGSAEEADNEPSSAITSMAVSCIGITVRDYDAHYFVAIAEEMLHGDT